MGSVGGRGYQDLALTGAESVFVMNVAGNSANRMSRESAGRASLPRLELRSLWAEEGVEILQTSWRRDRHPECSESQTGAIVLEFMQQGTYRREAGGGIVVGDMNTMVLFRPGEQFRIEHPGGDVNEGLSIRIEPHRLRGLLGPGSGSSVVADRLLCADEHSVGDQLHRMITGLMYQLVMEPICGSMWIEQRLVEMLVLLTRENDRRPREAGGRLCRGAEAERIAQARVTLNNATDRAVSLSELAEGVEWSVWHLVRVFRAHTGLSPYRYHLRLRLRAAHRVLRREGGDLSRVALRFGFSSHSHFTAAFRKEFGVPPSGVRDGGGCKHARNAAR